METHSQLLFDQVRERLIGHGFQVNADLGLASVVGVSDLYARRP